MFNRLGKKILPIIMATMLVASMSTLNAFAVETATEESTVATQSAEESATSVYKDEITGIKLESSDMTIKARNVDIGEWIGYAELVGLYEGAYHVAVYTDDGEYVDYDEVPVTLYLPCEKENCYVILEGFESDGLVQVDAEYVDGYYKVQMTNLGTYYVCDYPLAEGSGEIVEQTLVDEKTGVSVSGMIQTDSKLVVYNIKDMYNALLEERDDLDFAYGERPIGAGEKYDGYCIYIARNLQEARTEGDLTVTLPCETEGYEVRCINADAPMSDEDTYEADILGMNLAGMGDMSNEELADRLTAFIDKVYPALESEYVDGSYVVKNNFIGYYIIAPAGSFVVTPEYVKEVRSEYDDWYDDDYQEPTEAPTEAPTQVTTEAPTQAPTQASTQAPTQTTTNATTSTTQGKGTVNTSSSSNIPVLLSIIGVATATMVAFKKRIAK